MKTRPRLFKKWGTALIVVFLFGCATYYKGPEMDNFDGKRFFHRWDRSDKSLWTVLKWKLTSTVKPWPKEVKNEHTPHFANPLKAQEIEVTFVNHASVYFRHAGLSFLTDPQWSERTSPVSWAGPKRVRLPGVEIDKLPSLDYVLVSHNHYDHLDLATLEKLKKIYDPTFLIPLGDAYLLKDIGISKFKEFNWWEELDLGENRKAIYVPVKHWSARGIGDRNRSLWGGFVVTSPHKRILFAGDTGYCDIFKELKEKFGNFSLSFFPIGAYEPRWFMNDSHMNPEEAVLSHIDIQSQHSMGIHYGTWQLTDEAIDDPVIELAKAREKHKVSPEAFFTIGVGETKVLK